MVTLGGEGGGHGPGHGGEHGDTPTNKSRLKNFNSVSLHCAVKLAQQSAPPVFTLLTTTAHLPDGTWNKALSEDMVTVLPADKSVPLNTNAYPNP